MFVKEAMTRSVECARPKDSIAHAAERMRDLNVGALPVCGENEKLVGIVTDRDIAIRATAQHCDPDETCVSDAMTPGITWCFDDDDMTDAAHLMEDKQIRRLAVLNHRKRLVGILSLGDLAVKGFDDHLSGETLERVSEPAMPAR
jgi:CBS domain-containing protein